MNELFKEPPKYYCTIHHSTELTGFFFCNKCGEVKEEVTVKFKPKESIKHINIKNFKIRFDRDVTDKRP